ncbi:protease complex subunit PrcB family protein [Clostridium thermarum]|uniref:protease complex subunit PrcB family protein n=1 Tax=Clostridium thermarum TaxID=1716543 RepID=UPI0013D27D8E|nr:protease complex subunit PrcB family protein [Clostridium thermarum]
MKSLLKLTAVVAICALVAGCAKKGGLDTDEPKVNTDPVVTVGAKLESESQGITVNKISFEEVAEADIPDNLKDKIESSKFHRGFLYEEVDGYYYIAIFSGEKPTGGYGIKAVSIEDNEGATNIFVEETAPAEGDFVATVITYPYTVIKATGITPDITLFHKDGSNFEISQSAPEKMAVIKAEAQFLGQIDVNSIEVKLDGKIVAMQLGAVLREAIQNYKLEPDSMINIEYYENSNGQFVVEYLEEKEY